MDDHGQIYLLNLWNNEIVVFNSMGNISKTIALPGKPYKSITFEPMAGEGFLEVAGEGNRFIVAIPLFKGFVIDQVGKIIKPLSKEELLQPFPDFRLCNNNYAELHGRYVYDENFKLIKEGLPDFADSEGIYDSKQRILIKYSKDRKKKLWEKQFEGNFSILGVDGAAHLYLTGILKKGDPSSLYKLDSKGHILARATIPNPFPFITTEEKEEWETRSSEEFLSFFKLACNGDVYLIYQLGELPKLTFQRWLKGGEYFIYKFETKK